MWVPKTTVVLSRTPSSSLSDSPKYLTKELPPFYADTEKVRIVSSFCSLSKKQISLMFTDDLWIKNGKCLQAEHCFLTQEYHHSTTLTVRVMTLTMRVRSGCTCLLGGSLKFANFFLLWGPDIGIDCKAEIRDSFGCPTSIRWMHSA